MGEGEVGRKEIHCTYRGTTNERGDRKKGVGRQWEVSGW